MLAALAIAALAQGASPAPSPSIHDRVQELVLAADGGAASASVAYRAEFSGSLFARTFSETVDVHLELLDESGARLAEGRDEGPRHGAGARVEVEPGRVLGARVTVLASGAPVGTVRLELVAAPENETTRAAARTARALLPEAAALAESGDGAAARAVLERAYATLTAVEEAAASHEICSVLSRMVQPAHDYGTLSLARSAQSLVLAQRERTLPADHPNLVATRHNYANLLLAMGEIAEAGAIFAEVHDALERTLPADHPDLLRTRQNLGGIAQALGDLPRARALGESALAGFERTLPEDHPSTVEARMNLAATLNGLGDLQGAMVLFERVLAVYERTLAEDAPELRTARANAAVMRYGMGDSGRARALLERVLASGERMLPPDHPELLDARQNLAIVLRSLGDLEAARELDERVLEAWERALPEEHLVLTAARQSLAISLYQTGEHARAKELFERVLAAREQTLPEGHRQILTARGNLALVSWELGDRARALVLSRGALAAMERTLPADNDDLRLMRMLNVEQLHFADPESARTVLSALVDGLALRARFALRLAPREAREAVAADVPSLAQVLLASESGEPALVRRVFELIETRRLVVEETARAAGLATADPELGALARKASAARARLSDLIASAERGDGEPGPFAAALDRLADERDVAERQIARALVERGVAAEGIDAAALAATLPAGSAAVGFLRYPRLQENAEKQALDTGPDHLVAHVLRADGTIARVDLGPARELEAAVEAWRAALGRPLAGRGLGLASAGATELAVADHGARLGERLLAPVIAAAGEGISTLLVCPDDLVYLVPLDALPLAGDVAGDRLRILVQSSFARLLRRHEARAGAEASLLVVGGVDYDGEPSGSADPLGAVAAPVGAGLRGVESARLAFLPATSAEARAIAALFRAAHGREGRLLEGAGASKAAFAAAVQSASHVHLATHGWFAPEVVKSILDGETHERDGFARMSSGERVTGFAPLALCGLALAGANRGSDALGRVPGILSAEELTALDLSACRLAVLSACETNVGLRRAGQGIQSLQTALHAAGARTAITSLWKVDDAATQRLFELFYTKLWQERLGQAEALWQAKRTLRLEGRPVRDWAAWVLSGEPE